VAERLGRLATVVVVVVGTVEDFDFFTSPVSKRL
jgi:hypothetical protein